MLNGLVLMRVGSDGSIDVLDDGVDSDDLSNQKTGFEVNKDQTPAE